MLDSDRPINCISRPTAEWRIIGKRTSPMYAAHCSSSAPCQNTMVFMTRHLTLGSTRSAACFRIHPALPSILFRQEWRWSDGPRRTCTASQNGFVRRQRLPANSQLPGSRCRTNHCSAGWPFRFKDEQRYDKLVWQRVKWPGPQGASKKNLGNHPNRKYDSPCRSVRPRWPIDAGGFRHETRQAMGDPARGECPDPPRISRSESLPGRLLVLALAGLLVRGQPEQGCGARPKGQSRVHASMG